MPAIGEGGKAPTGGGEGSLQQTQGLVALHHALRERQVGRLIEQDGGVQQSG